MSLAQVNGPDEEETAKEQLLKESQLAWGLKEE